MQRGSDDQFAEWDQQRYGTGIDRFDQQHRRLFGLLNDLYTAMDEGHSQEEVGNILRELERYTEYHFGDEEEFMQDCGYAMDCANCFYNHREAHDDFATKVRELREKHENGEYVTMEVLTFVREWLDSHIAGADEDQNYGTYFQENVEGDYEYNPGTLRQHREGTTSPVPVDRREDAIEADSVSLGSRVYEGDALSFPEGSMAEWFETVAEHNGHRTAAVSADGTEHTFEDLYERARQVAGGLLAADVRPGDRLAISAASRYEWSVLDVACQLAGVVSVPVYTSFGELQTRYVLEKANVDTLASAGDPAPDVADVVETRFDIEDLPTDDPRVLPGLEAPGDDVATVVYDIATPEEPRGIALTHRNLLAAVGMLEASLPLEPGSTGTCFLPLAHVYQRVAAYYLWATGSAVAYLDVDDLRAELSAARPDVLVGVPKVYERLYGDLQDRIGSMGWAKRTVAGKVSAYGRDVLAGDGTPLTYRAAERLVYRPLREAFGLSALEYALSGAGHLDDHLVEFFNGIGVPITELYGPVETTGVGVINPGDSYARDGVGSPMPGAEVALSEEGEVLVRGPHVMAGYLDERATNYAVRDGWLHTGNTGSFDPDGTLSIQDRSGKA